jgi:hypothetical protein
MENPPSYDGSGLVNLIAEIERRMTGTSVFPGLTEASVVPDSASYVLVLFDGLGVAGLHHEDAGAFRASYVGSLDAPFPTTTSVSLATVATGLSPSQHAQVAHLSWYPDLGTVVNTLKWVRSETPSPTNTVHSCHTPTSGSGFESQASSRSRYNQASSGEHR